MTAPEDTEHSESERLAALASYNVLDTGPEEAFDRVTRLVSSLTTAPIVLVSLVDGSRQWFKSRVGLEAAETSRSEAFCAHAIRSAAIIPLLARRI